MNIFELMTLPFLECLVLVGIHSYLGLHVIRRRVIFVDLALAQIAALGTTVAFVFHMAPDSPGAYIFSLLFTLVGAAVFAITRVRHDKVPQEAVIGLVYALAASIGILVVFYAPHGAEHIQQIMSGAILWVKPEEVLHAAMAYAFVGAFHFIFRRRFLRISEDPEGAKADGINVRLWDFYFYASFGLVITHSVRTAGVLLVFVFLVVPAIMAVMLTDRVGRQLAVGWTAGTIVTVSGLALSYYGDLPSGPAVVSFYGVVLLVTAVILYIIRSRQRRLALTRVGLGLVVALALTFGFRELGHWLAAQPSMAQASMAGGGGHHHHHVMHGEGQDHSHGLAQSADSAGDSPEHVASTPAEAALSALETKLLAADITQKQALLAATQASKQLLALLKRSKDTEVRLTVAQRLLSLHQIEGAQALVEAMASADTPPMLRDEALESLKKAYGGDERGFAPWDEPTTDSNTKALTRWRALVSEKPQADKPPTP